MSKTYILEKTVVNFVPGKTGDLFATINLPMDSNVNAELEGTEYKNISFFVQYSEEDPIEFISGENSLDGTSINVDFATTSATNDLTIKIAGTSAKSGSAEFWITKNVTESFAELAGLPDMNVTLNYENPTNNGIALVTKALLMNISYFPDVDEEMLTDVTYNPGYAPFERLAKAVALCFDNPDPYTANSESYVVDFANDWERLAFAICPSMFLKQVVEPEDDGPIHTTDPGNPK